MNFYSLPLLSSFLLSLSLSLFHSFHSLSVSLFWGFSHKSPDHFTVFTLLPFLRVQPYLLFGQKHHSSSPSPYCLFSLFLFPFRFILFLDLTGFTKCSMCNEWLRCFWARWWQRQTQKNVWSYEERIQKDQGKKNSFLLFFLFKKGCELGLKGEKQNEKNVEGGDERKWNDGSGWF